MHHAKIHTMQELSKIIADEKARGEKVVHAHGVFDLLHIGHVLHLRTARSYGNRLVVTLTADRYVNKGVGRPVFSQQQRAEMLASLEIVDLVAVNDAPDAIPAIDAIKPNYYVKGPDYKNPEDDITGKITAEINAVRSHGGELVVTDDETHSSSALLNRHMGIYDKELQLFLNNFRDNSGPEQIGDLFDKVSRMKVLLVGDTIIDEYVYCDSIGKSAKESIIATKYMDTEVYAGGVVAAARHMADFVESVDVVTMVGDQDDYDELIRSVLPDNVRLHILTRADAPTTRKSRMVEPAYFRKMFEIYYFEDSPINGQLSRDLHDLIEGLVGKTDMTVVTDFGHGLISADTIDVLCEKSKFLAVNAQTNAANRGFNPVTRYRKADFICIDREEAKIAAQNKHVTLEYVIRDFLPKGTECHKFIITKGKDGCICFDSHKEGVHTIPALTQRVVDTIGAGDAFFVVTAPIIAVGGSLEEAGLVGNAAGAMKAQFVGHADSVHRMDLMKYVTALLK